MDDGAPWVVYWPQDQVFDVQVAEVCDVSRRGGDWHVSLSFTVGRGETILRLLMEDGTSMSGEVNG
ncbi:MAG: hypothetical protein R6U70_04770 [Bacillota bacterium]